MSNKKRFPVWGKKWKGDLLPPNWHEETAHNITCSPSKEKERRAQKYRIDQVIPPPLWGRWVNIHEELGPLRLKDALRIRSIIISYHWIESIFILEPFEPLHSSLSYGVPTRSQHPSEGPPNSLRQKLLQVGLSGTQGNRLELPCFQEEETEAGDPSLSLPSPASCSLGTSTLMVANAPSAVTPLSPRELLPWAQRGSETESSRPSQMVEGSYAPKHGTAANHTQKPEFLKLNGCDRFWNQSFEKSGKISASVGLRPLSHLSVLAQSEGPQAGRENQEMGAPLVFSVRPSCTFGLGVHWRRGSRPAWPPVQGDFPGA